MTDKVQKIKEWISKEQDGLMDANGNFDYPEHEGAYNILCNLDAYIDSLQEEPASEFINTESMIEAYKQRLISEANGMKNSPLIDMCLASYKHGINEILDTLNLSNVEGTIKNQKEFASEELEKALLRLCPLPPCYNEEQRKSKDYADSWWRARDEQNGFRLGAFWQKKNIIYIACEWLRNHLADYWDKENNYLNISGCIYEFREAMKSAKKGEPVEKDKLRALSDGKQHLGWLDDAEALENHVSDGLGDYINELSKQFPEVSFAKLSRIAVRVAKWQKEQMMAKAIDGTARPDDNEIWCNLTSNNLEDGDKVKIIVIKEDEL